MMNHYVFFSMSPKKKKILLIFYESRLHSNHVFISVVLFLTGRNNVKLMDVRNIIRANKKRHLRIIFCSFYRL